MNTTDQPVIVTEAQRVAATNASRDALRDQIRRTMATGS